MDIRDIRRHRLRKLLVAKYDGKQAAFAALIGRSPSYVARIVSSNSTHSRNIGEALAREIEQLCDVPSGYLDLPLTKIEEAGDWDPATDPPGVDHTKVWQDLPARLMQKIEYYRDHTEIPVMDVQASMGNGAEPPQMEIIASSLRLETGWLRRTLPMTDPENLRVVTGMGESMAPTISHGDLLIVDVGVTAVSYDGVYLLLMHDVLLVKRVQRGFDSLLIISDNPLYKEIAVPAAMEEKVKVLGRIVYIWNGHKS